MTRCRVCTCTCCSRRLVWCALAVLVMACGAGVMTIGFVDQMTIDDPVAEDPEERRNELERRKEGAKSIITIGAIELGISGGFYIYYLIRQQAVPTPEEILRKEKEGALPGVQLRRDGFRINLASLSF